MWEKLIFKKTRYSPRKPQKSMVRQTEKSEKRRCYVLEQFAKLEKHRENRPLSAIAKKRKNLKPEYYFPLPTVHRPLSTAP
jgi:hypothetical protein